ncbi:MAG: hypothetical protein HY720_28210 [Planctomycetes bacterium]|nr:hypothetical protein [Planctomycetota bacterium]
MRTWLRLRAVAGLGSGASRLAVELVALANSGYGAENPQIAMPLPLASALGYWPTLPPEAQLRWYGSAGGQFQAWAIPGAVDVSVLTPDRVQGPVVAEVHINPQRPYSLMSSTLLTALRIVLLSPGEGVWAFADELARPRQSEPAPEGG